jgi:hypothetical protein
MVAISTAIPLSPHNDIAIAVPKVAAAVLTKLFPRSTVERNFSGFSIILATRPAPATPLLSRCLIRIFCKEIKAISELEKKAESRIQKKIRIMYKMLILSINASRPIKVSFRKPVFYLKRPNIDQGQRPS